MRTPLSVPAGLLITGTHEDPAKPRLEAIGVPEPREVAPCKQEGLLDGILCPLDIAEDPDRDRKARVTCKVDELREGGGIAGHRTFDRFRPHCAVPFGARMRRVPLVLVGLRRGRFLTLRGYGVCRGPKGSWPETRCVPGISPGARNHWSRPYLVRAAASPPIAPRPTIDATRARRGLARTRRSDPRSRTRQLGYPSARRPSAPTRATRRHPSSGSRAGRRRRSRRPRARRHPTPSPRVLTPAGHRARGARPNRVARTSDGRATDPHRP